MIISLFVLQQWFLIYKKYASCFSNFTLIYVNIILWKKYEFSLSTKFIALIHKNANSVYNSAFSIKRDVIQRSFSAWFHFLFEVSTQIIITYYSQKVYKCLPRLIKNLSKVFFEIKLYNTEYVIVCLTVVLVLISTFIC